MNDGSVADNFASTKNAAVVTADTFISKMRSKLHHFIEQHTLLEAIVEEKEALLGQRDAEIVRLNERIAILQAHNANLVNAQQGTDAPVGKSKK